MVISGQQFKAPQAETELVPSTTIIKPGEPFFVAMHMKMAPGGWHSYYANPGESGQATSIRWHLPSGFKAGPILWPTPKRIVIGGVAGYVYENNAWLTTEITPPSSLSSGQSVHIGADIDWLLCREACVPQKASRSLTLKVGSITVANPLFAPASKLMTSKLNAEKVRATAAYKSVVISVASEVPATTGIRYFAADPTYFGAEIPEVKSTKSGINLVVPLSKYAPGPPKRVTGILVIPAGSAKGAHWIDVKVTER